MALQNLGTTPSRPTDTVDVEWVTSAYPSFSAFVSTSASTYTPVLPTSPADHQMHLVEVYASTTGTTVNTPVGVLLCRGLFSTTTIPVTKTGFFGYRYSAHAGAWFLLSTAVQA